MLVFMFAPGRVWGFIKGLTFMQVTLQWPEGDLFVERL